MSEVKLYDLYRQVDEAIQKQSYSTVVEICNKIIGHDPKEVDAIRCKIIALIQQDKFDEAVTTIDKSSIAKELSFEKAYSLYRARKYKEALEALKNTPKSKKTQEIEAQIMFRLEQYDRAVEIYEAMLAESKTGSAELLTNLTAALTAAGRSKRCLDVLAKYKQTMRKSFELTYNGACCYVEMGDLDTGDQYLQAAQTLCEDTLKKDGASEEEIQDELNIILTQQAYTQQRRGKETAEIYEKVLKTKPSDLSVQAVCMNNLAVIRKGDKVNSYNKLKQVSSNPSVIEKLSTKQRKSIGFNRSILLILLGKMEESRQLANELQKEFPQSEFLPIVNAAIYHAEKNYNQAANVLKEYVKQNPKGSIEVKLSLAQIYLQQRNMTELNSLLQSNVDQINSSPALLNKLAALYERTGDVENALKFLDESVSKLSKSDENYRQLVKRNADFKMKYKKYRDAAEWYNKILEVNKNDKEALPLAVIATAHYNPDAAEKLETKLPQLAEDHHDIDVDRLETIPVISTRRYRAQENQIAKTTKKRKRHNKKPKHFDPRIPPNPERWLPRWQRTKGGKRGKKGPQKGPAQGAAHLVKEEERKQAAAQEKLAQPKDAAGKNQAPPPGSKNKPVLNVNKKRRRK